MLISPQPASRLCRIDPDGRFSAPASDGVCRTGPLSAYSKPEAVSTPIWLIGRSRGGRRRHGIFMTVKRTRRPLQSVQQPSY